MSCREQSLFDKSDVFRIPRRFFCINTFENTPLGCNMMPPSRKTWPRFDIHINDEVIKNPNPMISLSVSSMYRTINVWPIRCFSIHMSLVLHQHIKKTRQSDVIWCRKHDKRDDGSISTLMTRVIKETMNNYRMPLVSDCTIGNNFSFSYSTPFKSCQTMQSHSLHDPAQFHLDSFHSKQNTVVGICHVGNNHFLTNQMFSEYHVDSFASTHSKTSHSDVIWCRHHGRRDHGSISTLMTKLLKTLTLTLRYRCRYLPCTEQ